MTIPVMTSRDSKIIFFIIVVFEKMRKQLFSTAIFNDSQGYIKKESPGVPGEVIAVGIGYKIQPLIKGIIYRLFWCFNIRE